MAEQEYFDLNTGAKIPAVGLGTWKSQPGEVGAAILAALEAGYKHIDCASIYGNEPEVGAALQEAFAKGLAKREDIFITSKLWPTEFMPEDVLPACQKTLKDLQLEYVDLYLLPVRCPVRPAIIGCYGAHQVKVEVVQQDLQLDYLDLYLLHVPCPVRKPLKFPPTIEDKIEPWDMAATWRAMEELQKKGLVKAIGVSNWTIKKLETLLSSNISIVPAANQVELHPVWHQDKLLEYCKSKGIHVTAYSPLGSPDRPALAVFPGTPVLLDNPTLKEIAAKVGKSPAQVAIRWAVQRGTSVLPKSVNPERIKQNLDVFSWSIPDEDFKALSSIQPQVRILDFRGIWVGEGLPALTCEEFWDGEM